MLVVNLFGAPGAGKSTGAAYIFSKLKMNGVNAELITEFAKEKVWENNEEVFKNQVYLFGKQSYRMSRCRDKVSVLVTDSPLPLSIFYNRDERIGEELNKTVMTVFNTYNNLNYLLLRVKPYNPDGRHQTEHESDELNQPMIDMLNNNQIGYTECNGDIDGYEKIISEVLDWLQKDGIKPCPFCGQGEAGVKDHHGYYSVCCGYQSDGKPSRHCRQDWGEFETEIDAINAWNRRAKF